MPLLLVNCLCGQNSKRCPYLGRSHLELRLNKSPLPSPSPPKKPKPICYTHLYTFIHCARLPPLSRILHVDIVLKARAETLTEINFISSMKLPKRCRMLSTSSLEHLKKCGKNIRDFVPLSICLHEVTRYKMWSARAAKKALSGKCQ